jgi:hypothetical protein
VQQPTKVTYRLTDQGWEALLSTGGRLEPEPDLVSARKAAHEYLGKPPDAENVKVPMEGHGLTWAGLRFELLPPLYGADAPTAEQNDRLTACFDYYRERLPDGMRVECAGHRVRVDPAPTGLVASLFSALDGTGEETTGRARDQLQLAKAIEVPDGFVRVVHEFVGLEEFGDVGHFHLVLRERWPEDAPCL